MWNQPNNNQFMQNQMGYDNYPMNEYQQEMQMNPYHQEMANNLIGQAMSEGLFVANNFEQNQFNKELDKYNNRLLAKMNNLQTVPKVTTPKVKTALHQLITTTYGQVAESQITFVQLEEIPHNNLWRHACYYVGLVGGSCYTTRVYTTDIYFIFCPSCLTVHFYYEKKTEDEFYSY